MVVCSVWIFCKNHFLEEDSIFQCMGSSFFRGGEGGGGAGGGGGSKKTGGGREVWALSLNWGFFPKMRFHQFLTLTLNPITSYILLTYWLNWTYSRKNGKRYQFINLLLKIHGTLFFGSLKLLTFVVLHTKRKWQQILI